MMQLLVQPHLNRIQAIGVLQRVRLGFDLLVDHLQQSMQLRLLRIDELYDRRFQRLVTLKQKQKIVFILLLLFYKLRLMKTYFNMFSSRVNVFYF
jgi:hypothetical protein